MSLSMRQDGQQDRSASFARQDQQQQQQQQQQSRQAQANATVRVRTEDETQPTVSPVAYRARGTGRIDISV